MITTTKRLAALVIALAGLPLAARGPAAQAAPPPCTRFLSIADYRAVEGTSLTGVPTIFTFTVTSTGCAAAGAFDFGVRFGTATPDDLTATGGSISLAAGDLSPRTIPVRISADATAERDEQFAVRICHPTSSGLDRIEIARAEAQGFVLNDDSGALQEPGAPPHGFRCSE